MNGVAARFQRGRPVPHGLELRQALAALHERFGAGTGSPVLVGRYRVRGRLGRGGLGLVLRAHDPSLDREVAIKVLGRGREGDRQDARLLQEARVLAQVRHPNVVEVFDVGFFDDGGRSRFFVAMELVEGTDLRRWLERPRALAEVVRAFVAVGEGLAAAHDAGLLHRDLKPSNVLVGRDGAVKVADFGLAAFTDELRADSSATWSAGGDGGTTSWRPGGTPPYMAPEQHRGEPLTAASDQYGLCVSLFEALHGRRPFEGEDQGSLLRAKERGVELVRPEAIDPPAWAVLRRVLRRGLDPSPDARYPDVRALVHELRRALGSPRRGWVAVAGVAALTLGAVTLAAARGGPEPSEPAPTCAALPPQAERGAPPREGALAERLDASPALSAAWPELAGALDEYAAGLRRRWDDACAQPPPARDEAHRCLTRSAEALASLRELFAEGDPEVLARGWSLVPELPDLQFCRRRAAEPQREAEMLRRATTARASLLAAAGRLPEARVVLGELREELGAQGATRALRLLEIDEAELSMNEGRYDEARAQLEAVHFAAAAEGDTYGAARAAVMLIIESYRMGNADAAEHWARTARPLLRRLQPRDADLEAVLEHNVALARFAAGRFDEALEAIREAIERASAPGVEPGLLDDMQQVHAEILLHAGRPAEALEIHRSILHTGEGSPPRDGVSTVVDLQSLGNALITLHQLDEAARAYRRSYELARSILGPEHPHTTAACISLARAEGDRGEVAKGRALFDACLPALEQQLGDDHPHVAVARAMGARLAWQAGEHDQARRVLRESLGSIEQAFGESHYAVADILHELGTARAAAGDWAEAREALERALEIRRGALPQGHVNLAESLLELARLDQRTGQPERAAERLEQAVALFEARGLGPAAVAELRASLTPEDEGDADGGLEGGGGEADGVPDARTNANGGVEGGGGEADGVPSARTNADDGLKGGGEGEADGVPDARTNANGGVEGGGGDGDGVPDARTNANDGLEGGGEGEGAP